MVSRSTASDFPFVAVDRHGFLFKSPVALEVTEKKKHIHA